MKKRLLSLIAAMSMLASAAVPVRAEESGIYGWTYSSADAGASCTADNKFFVDGTKSAHLSVSTADGVQTLKTELSAEPKKSYVISFWARSVNSSSFSFSAGNSRYNLLSAMKSYDWTEFTYKYTQGDDNVLPLSFELKGKGEAYVDGVRVCDEASGVNIVTNGGFDSAENEAADKTAYSQRALSDARKDMTKEGTLPLIYNSGITADGDFSDWNEDAKIMLPSENNIQISNYAGSKDLSAEFMCAYDDEFLYINAKVTDDVHCQPNTGSGYWRGDSIQLALGDKTEDYGIEIGFYLTDSGEAKVYSDELEKTEWGAQDQKVLELREKTVCAANRTDDCTYYEIAVPWNIKFDEIPDEFLLNILINDNDGNGRRGYIEWREGIGKTKSNERFVSVVPIKKDSEIYAYIDGDRSIMEKESGEYRLCIVNTTEKDTAVRAESENDGKELTLSAESVYTMPLAFAAHDAGEHDISARIVYDGGEYTAKKQITAERNLQLAFEAFEQTRLAELEGLKAECVKKGILTDYEDITLAVIRSFAGYGLEDYNGGRAARAQYVYDCLEKLYDEAKTSLSSYLDGTAEPKQAVFYQSSNADIVNKTLYAETKDAATGEIRRSPVFLSGYLDATRSSDEISEVGANLLQFEVPMSGYLGSADTVRGWIVNRNGGVSAQYSYDKDAYKGSRSLKISNQSAKASNVYTNISQNISLKGGRKYQLSFWAKGDSAESCSLRPNGWKSSKISLSGTYDWKKVTYEYAPEEDMTVELMFMCEDVTAGLYLDNIRLCEKGTNQNLVRQGGFEELPVVINGYSVDVDRFKREVITALDEAEQNNVAVDILMSVHYFPEKLLDKEHWQSNQIGFVKHNLFDEEVQKMCEAFFKGLVPLMANHKALSSICISNEPTYRTGLDESNTPAWHSYLKELYNNDIGYANSVWHENYGSFEEVALASEYENPAMYYDYLRFNDKMFAKWHKRIAELTKELAPGVPVHSKMMAVVEQAETSGKNFPLVRGTDPELFAEFSDLNGNDSWNFIGSSRTMTLKSMWYDLLTSIKNAPVFNSEDHVVEDRDERYNEKYAPHFATDLWQGAVHGRSMMTMWKWARTLSTTSSTSGNIKHRPDAVALEGHTMLDLMRLANEMEALQNAKPDAAIFYSYPSRVYEKTHMNAVYKSYEALTGSGLCAKFVTEKTIAGGALENIPLLIVPCVQSIDKESLGVIDRYIENGGKVITIGDCFLYDEHKNTLGNAADNILSQSKSIAAETGADGTHVTPSESISAVIKNYITPEIEIIDCATGSAITDAEWRYTEYNGTTLVNVCLFDRDGGRTVKIMKNGAEIIGSYELRSCKKLEREFYLNGYEPMLIRIE